MHNYFFFSCPERGLGNDGARVFYDCVLHRDFGRFRKGATVRQIYMSAVTGEIDILDAHGGDVFTVEVIPQGKG